MATATDEPLKAPSPDSGEKSQLPIPTEVENPPNNGERRRSFWTDAAAKFDRRIDALEVAQEKSIWSIPLYVALGLGALALSGTIFCIILISRFRRV